LETIITMTNNLTDMICLKIRITTFNKKKRNFKNYDSQHSMALKKRSIPNCTHN